MSTIMLNINKRILKHNLLINIKRKLHHKKIKDWNSVIGLEVHAQILSNSKLFSGAPTDFAGAVNCNVALFDAAIPGTLPVLNKRCVEAGVLTALSLSCNLNTVSYFDRKHYFYADLPAGYQITQQRLPLAINGFLHFPVYNPGVHKNPYKKSVRIKQLQLEQDSGKSLHDTAESYSLVDLNRAGVPLMEIVFEPDLRDGEEAAALVKELTLILSKLGTCSCKMEEGALRVDANISVNRPDEPLGVRSEVKNIGSIRGVASAVKYEIDRQIKILESGGTVINETRSWDAQNKKTVAMRDKETVQDYRYMPEPNLPPLHLNVGQYPKENDYYVNVLELKQNIPELPEDTRKRLCEKYRIQEKDVLILVNSEKLLNLFTKITERQNIDPKITINILVNDLLTIVNREKLDLEETKLSVDYLRELVEIYQMKVIGINTMRNILEKIVQGTHESPKKIIEKNDLLLISDTATIQKLVNEILESNGKMVDQYLNGKQKVFKALLGQIAARSKGRANMAEASKILQITLENMKKG